MADTGDQGGRSFAERTRSVLSDVGQNDRVKQAAAKSKDLAARAQQTSNAVTRKVAQQDAWDEMRGDLGLLSEIARAQHALIIDLVERVSKIESSGGNGQPTGNGQQSGYDR